MGKHRIFFVNFILLLVMCLISVSGCKVESELTQSPDSPVAQPTQARQNQEFDLGYEPDRIPQTLIAEDHARGKTIYNGKSELREEVYIEDAGILLLDSSPLQFILSVTGMLPTPCHQMRYDISKPDRLNRIYVDFYSIVDPTLFCIQVMEPFEASLPLITPSGTTYSIWVNKEFVGEISQ